MRIIQYTQAKRESEKERREGKTRYPSPGQDRDGRQWPLKGKGGKGGGEKEGTLSGPRGPSPTEATRASRGNNKGGKKKKGRKKEGGRKTLSRLFIRSNSDAEGGKGKKKGKSPGA